MYEVICERCLSTDRLLVNLVYKIVHHLNRLKFLFRSIIFTDKLNNLSCSTWFNVDILRTLVTHKSRCINPNKLQMLIHHRKKLNPIFHEFCFPSIFEIYLKIGSYHLQTHRRDAHSNFFITPSYFKIIILVNLPLCRTLLSKGLNVADKNILSILFSINTNFSPISDTTSPLYYWSDLV